MTDGGAEVLVKDYASMLDKKKFNVIVITKWKGFNTANESILNENNIKSYSMYPRYSIFWRIFNIIFGSWYIPFKLNRILKQEKVDVLHIHMVLLKYVNQISNKIKNIRLLYTCHNLPDQYFSGRNKKEAKAARHLIKENGLRLIALHDEMKTKLNDMFDVDNTVVIRNGIDFKRFQNVKDSKEKIRKSLGVPKDAYVIGNVGRFHRQKNHEFLVEIFSELVKRKDNAFLLLVGAGELKENIEKKLYDYGLDGKYLILSHRSDIPEIMKAMDVFVFPSLYEGLPVALIEAQVSGLKCVVSNAINSESYLSEKTIAIGLDKSTSEWCDVILDDTIKGKNNVDINNYDMNKEIKRLEELYLHG
jgi:glycosyltransferase involved in cell wall biosynthesis